MSPSTALAEAITSLAATAQQPLREGAPTTSWRWTVRQTMSAVRDALMQERAGSEDGWLAARGGTAFRERNTLLGRLGDLGSRVLEDPDVDSLRADVRRLVSDVSRHVQRVNDLAYDEVELELGGSE
ncbi:MAG: hypothetical protein WB471_01740 [Nocardioides sp.]